MRDYTVKIFSDVLEEDTVTKTNNFLLSKELPWYFSQTSTTGGNQKVNDPTVPTFWYTEFDMKKDKVVSDVWDEMYSVIQTEDTLGSLELEVVRTYGNGQTYGLNGQLHTDDERPNTWTALYYAVEDDWDVEWHGETYFYDDDKENVVGACIPKRNRFVVFDSTINHVGMAPNKQYNGLRVTLAFKLQSINETKPRVATDASFSSSPSTPSNGMSDMDMGDIEVSDDGFVVS